jgi:hypothetical protein
MNPHFVSKGFPPLMGSSRVVGINTCQSTVFDGNVALHVDEVLELLNSAACGKLDMGMLWKRVLHRQGTVKTEWPWVFVKVWVKKF